MLLPAVPPTVLPSVLPSVALQRDHFITVCQILFIHMFLLVY